MTPAVQNANAAPAPALVNKLLYSRKDSAFALSISIRSLDLAIAAGKIVVRKLGKRIVIPADALLAYASVDHATLTTTPDADPAR